MGDFEIDSNCMICKDKENEINYLKSVLKEKEQKIRHLEALLLKHPDGSDGMSPSVKNELELNNHEIMRYSRQMILPEIGVKGQKRLKSTSVLIVGAGGLGCPAGLYLAAAGIGEIGIVDYDDVELSNMHRQVLHYEEDIGTPKCESFARTIRKMNSSTLCICHKTTLNSKNAEDLMKHYDIILDASDNVATRYLLNDASVLLHKPLVSGSALRFEGQLNVYNYEGGPCYRCLYPTPPSPDATSRCSESGVIGPVTGVIGCLQALETIKISVGLIPSFVNRMLYFDGESGQFRIFKVRGKNPKCAICGNNPTIHQLIDYEVFCQSSATDKAENVYLLPDSKRISCNEYSKLLDVKEKHILLDVRSACEFEICALPDSINIPLNALMNEDGIDKLKTRIRNLNCSGKGFVVCHRGNDSQRAVILLEEKMKDLNLKWYDIKGGLEAWHCEIDDKFPVY